MIMHALNMQPTSYPFGMRCHAIRVVENGLWGFFIKYMMAGCSCNSYFLYMLNHRYIYG